MTTVLTLFGTRPEAIKLAPVIRAIREQTNWQPVTVCSSQHTDLLIPFVQQLSIPIDFDLQVMTSGQTPTDVLSKVVTGLQKILTDTAPDLVLVQGDTTTALAGALAASYQKIPVGHVEAGLRTGNRMSPFPEELNRRIIGQTADLHFAATRANAAALLREGINPDDVFDTGNTVVDSLKFILNNSTPSEQLAELLVSLAGKKIVAMTTHRRENFGDVMVGYMRCIRDFAERHPEVAVVFPVHPNPNVSQTALHELSGRERIHLVEPLRYSDFIHLLSKAWLIASDSGGVVEEAPTLGKPVLVLRDTTERPEAVDCGVAKLVGHSPQQLDLMLEETLASDEWPMAARRVINPFGSGDASQRIVKAIESRFGARWAKNNSKLVAVK
ncbi:MAG: UDP-N-acetylglucosamine 2-epimerase (non-hydrolyzing) [Burkholderiaceae bacterium]